MGSIAWPLETPNCNRLIGRSHAAVICLLAGGYAQKKGWSHQGASNDLLEFAGLLNFANRIRQFATSILNYMRARTKRLLRTRRNAAAVRAVADALLKRKTLTRKQVKRIVNKVMKLKRGSG
jgi:hypothetical protein